MLCVVVGACSSSPPSSVAPPLDDQLQASTPSELDSSDPSVSASIVPSQIGNPYTLEESKDQELGISLTASNQRFPRLCQRFPWLRVCNLPPNPCPRDLLANPNRPRPLGSLA
jgi:hypothetical protein